MRFISPLVFSLLWPVPALAQSVTVEHGVIFYQPAGGSARRRIDPSGMVRDARLSPDGRTIAYVDGTPDRLIAAAGEATQATELKTIGVDGRNARVLVRGRPSESPREVLADFMSPRFSPDGRRIYFLSSGWATSGAVHAVDVATGREWFVVPGNSLEVVRSGEYAGHLLVSQHRYFLVAGSYDWLWLFTPDGREVGPVGEDEGAAEEFREMYETP
ncbi:MAG TPA: hypothetical protein VFJ16_29930 [Longimicrobium sp.]|nr:hypothetical protein [Longimicrobium sp.]